MSLLGQINTLVPEAMGNSFCDCPLSGCTNLEVLQCTLLQPCCCPILWVLSRVSKWALFVTTFSFQACNQRLSQDPQEASLVITTEILNREIGSHCLWIQWKQLKSFHSSAETPGMSSWNSMKFYYDYFSLKYYQGESFVISGNENMCIWCSAKVIHSAFE